MNERTARVHISRWSSKRTTSLGALITAIYDAAAELSSDAKQVSVLAVDALADTLRHQHAAVAIGLGNP